jgi:hypothetical protein
MLKWSTTAIVSTFTKLTPAGQASAKNSYTEFYIKDLTNCLIADHKLQTDGRISPCKAPFSFLVVKTPNKSNKNIFPQFCEILPSNILFLLPDFSLRFFHPRRPPCRFSQRCVDTVRNGTQRSWTWFSFRGSVWNLSEETCYPKNNFHLGHPVVLVDFRGPFRWDWFYCFTVPFGGM